MVTSDAAHDDAPAGPGAVVDHVGLEDHRPIDDGVDLRPRIGAEHDRLLEDGVVDDAHDGRGGIDDQSADVLGRQQRQAGRAIELEQLGGSGSLGHASLLASPGRAVAVRRPMRRRPRGSGDR